MQYVRDDVIEILLKSYETYYNVENKKELFPNLVAICEYFEKSQKYVLSQKAELWSANSEEFIYLFNFESLTADLVKSSIDYALQDGLERSHIGPGHMYTYITPIFICDSCDEEAKRIIKKCKIYKSFKFSLHGWMDFHTAVVEVNDNTITTNSSGKCVGKTLEKVLFQKKRRKVI